jgi:hypothetical protein
MTTWPPWPHRSAMRWRTRRTTRFIGFRSSGADQPLPRCESHRYSRPKRAPMKCATQLKKVVIPHFRRSAAARLEPVGVTAHLPPPRPFRGVLGPRAGLQDNYRSDRGGVRPTGSVPHIVGVASAVARRDDAAVHEINGDPSCWRAALAGKLPTLKPGRHRVLDLTRGTSSPWVNAGTGGGSSHRPRLIDLQLKGELRRLPPDNRQHHHPGALRRVRVRRTDIRRNQQKVERRYGAFVLSGRCVVGQSLVPADLRHIGGTRSPWRGWGRR